MSGKTLRTRRAFRRERPPEETPTDEAGDGPVSAAQDGRPACARDSKRVREPAWEPERDARRYRRSGGEPAEEPPRDEREPPKVSEPVFPVLAEAAERDDAEPAPAGRRGGGVRVHAH